ncbi:hypothetical protein [Streptomyces sp. NPDC093568]|uniref:hypothetical protein n=1 Tax=Streptomyces sp. NPDC093568 TaxID=3366041 RepID=UPI00382E0BD0
MRSTGPALGGGSTIITRRPIAPEKLDTLNLAGPRLHAESDLSAVWRDFLGGLSARRSR